MYKNLEFYSVEEDLGYENVPSDLYDLMESDEEGNPRGFLSDERYWETFLPVIEFNEGKLKKIELYPVELGMNAPRSQRGRPMVRSGEKGKSILKKIKDLSKIFDTKIEILEDKGIVDL